jgi:hypothetical protein
MTKPRFHLAFALGALSLGALTLANCGPAPLKAPIPGRTDTGTPAPTVKGIAFISGEWRDDLGNTWVAIVNDAAGATQTVTAQGKSGPSMGLVLLGDVKDGILSYRISTPDGIPLASGSAQMINANHAFFDTRLPDGSPNADGVLHINHAPPAQPEMVTGAADCAAVPATPPALDGEIPTPSVVEPSKPFPEVPAPRDLRPAQPAGN